MKKRELEMFRRILQQQLAELTQKSNAMIADLMNSTVQTADPNDQATFDFDRDFTLRILSRENQLIRKIKKAMQKIEDHTFGVCEICDEDIPIERLKLRPVAELCIDCKTYQEKLERLTCE
jgi:DnaK suppressor protein